MKLFAITFLIISTMISAMDSPTRPSPLLMRSGSVTPDSASPKGSNPESPTKPNTESSRSAPGSPTRRPDLLLRRRPSYNTPNNSPDSRNAVNKEESAHRLDDTRGSRSPEARRNLLKAISKTNSGSEIRRAAVKAFEDNLKSIQEYVNDILQYDEQSDKKDYKESAGLIVRAYHGAYEAHIQKLMAEDNKKEYYQAAYEARNEPKLKNTEELLDAVFTVQKEAFDPEPEVPAETARQQTIRKEALMAAYNAAQKTYAKTLIEHDPSATSYALAFYTATNDTVMKHFAGHLDKLLLKK